MGLLNGSTPTCLYMYINNYHLLGTATTQSDWWLLHILSSWQYWSSCPFYFHSQSTDIQVYEDHKLERKDVL